MTTLALDTSGEVCSVALCGTDGAMRSVYHFQHDRHLVERLPGIVQSVLHECGMTLPDISGFAVGIGPGSFTGVRVGVTFAKTWAYALNRPVVGVCSLDAVVCSIAPVSFAEGFVTIVPTRKTEGIAAAYRVGELSPLAPPDVLAYAELADQLQIWFPGASQILVLGEAAEAARQACAEMIQSKVRFAVAFPDASRIGYLASARLARGESDDLHALTPLYVAPSPVG